MLTDQGTEILKTIGAGVGIILAIILFRIMAHSTAVTEREMKMCHMQLQTLKTLPDTITFVKTDSGSACLAYIPTRY